MIAERAEQLRRRIASALERTGRAPSEVEIIVVTKGRTLSEVAAAQAAGFRHFAENRAQDLDRRLATFSGDATWDFIGPLQRNKVRLVRPVVRYLHSLDRPQLADAWVKGPGTPPPVLVQVNIGEEPQKAGVRPGELRTMLRHCEDLGLRVHGLMAIPPRPTEPEDSRPHFAALRRLRDDVRETWPDIQHLSMGMSEDFEIAVEEGATMLRPGRAIFGELHPGSE